MKTFALSDAIEGAQWLALFIPLYSIMKLQIQFLLETKTMSEERAWFEYGKQFMKVLVISYTSAFEQVPISLIIVWCKFAIAMFRLHRYGICYTCKLKNLTKKQTHYLGYFLM